MPAVFVVKDLAAADCVGIRDRFPVLPAPIFASAAPVRPFRAASFADILAIRGYTDAHELEGALAGWDRLIEQVRPDLIICDYSPTLCLAAAGALPVFELGSGFAVPPADGTHFPTINSAANPRRCTPAPSDSMASAVSSCSR
jgi:hypothetical protein